MAIEAAVVRVLVLVLLVTKITFGRDSCGDVGAGCQPSRRRRIRSSCGYHIETTMLLLLLLGAPLAVGVVSALGWVFGGGVFGG